ncbi:tetratricopeptide repeat protein [Cohnella lubricantis]|uniref:Tetratricopeptide repeat protein n=1 Tax=Cohnella lubricantis TaxID=2163172 RepID=A0A841TCG5_9BACL|nr:tetratricopeptide repeat protein [Cohnella lubricantis]MBB6677846.1 tetratricopeptide repeat protein [Cohnella lubricantis]MBP2119025.1 tetratricopeptide (TPR) repeat protein [Cohnella lubricantis]
MTDHTQQKYRFSEAPIWELQRQYYEEKGLHAWNNDQVPQYITSNPMIGTAYAEIIFGFLQDRAAKGEVSDPVLIVELGAGAGRLASHILHTLDGLREDAAIVLPPYRYVMTDLAVKNVEGWRRHAVLQPYIEQGVLDFAVFDAVGDEEIRLTESQTVIRPGDLKQPMLVVANYFFCGIPQELLYIGEGQVYECDVLVERPERSDSLSTSEELQRITLQYENRPAPEYEADSYPYREVIDLYKKELEDSHVLFPELGLRCLERLNRLSKAGFLLITADKGDHRLDNWRFAEPPELIYHGSFSLTANYHAFQYTFEQRGGLALFTPHHYKNLNVGCIFMLENPNSYTNARLAHRRFVQRFGPDDFFSLKSWVDERITTMGLQPILAFWRLGGYDAEFFIQSAKRISSLLAEANDEELLDLQLGIQTMWSSYYVMEQGYNLALDIGIVLFEMNSYETARHYLELALREEEEPDALILYCLAICHLELGSAGEAKSCLQRALELEPGHEEALELLSCLE